MDIKSNSFYTEAHTSHQVKAARLHTVHSKADGHWFARLIENNPRVARSFADHEAVAHKLEASAEGNALAIVASSGMLDSCNSGLYRDAFHRLAL